MSSPYDSPREKKKATQAFTSPSQLAQRLGRRVSSPVQSEASVSSLSRRSQSLVRTKDDADVMREIGAATGVMVASSPKSRINTASPRTTQSASPIMVDDLLRRAEMNMNSARQSNLNMMESFSPSSREAALRKAQHLGGVSSRGPPLPALRHQGVDQSSATTPEELLRSLQASAAAKVAAAQQQPPATAAEAAVSYVSSRNAYNDPPATSPYRRHIGSLEEVVTESTQVPSPVMSAEAREQRMDRRPVPSYEQSLGEKVFTFEQAQQEALAYQDEYSDSKRVSFEDAVVLNDSPVPSYGEAHQSFTNDSPVPSYGEEYGENALDDSPVLVDAHVFSEDTARVGSRRTTTANYNQYEEAARPDRIAMSHTEESNRSYSFIEQIRVHSSTPGFDDNGHGSTSVDGSISDPYARAAGGQDDADIQRQQSVQTPFSDITDPRATPYGEMGIDQAGSTASRSHLDLKNNDNAFHVLANLLVDYFQSKVVNGQSVISLRPEDKEHIERLLPRSARLGFIEAVRFRLQRVPAEPADPLDFVTLQCEQLCFDKEGAANPILAGMAVTTVPINVPVLVGRPMNQPQEATSPTGGEDAGNTVEAIAASHSLEENSTRSGWKSESEMEQQSRDGSRASGAASERTPVVSAAKETISTAFVSKAVVGAGGYNSTKFDGQSTTETSTQASNTENVARQQLLAELREASNLMTESVTPETAKFWRDHVLDLQSRLRVLYGEEDGMDESHASQTTEDILAMNRRLLSKYDRRDDPRTISTTRSKASTDSTKLPSRLVLNSEYEAPFVDVVAPADLPAGYHFEAELNGERFLATVPPGGIKQGETFTCVMRELKSVAIDIPVGYWKDDAHEICKTGCCHPVVLNSTFCPLVAVSQVEARLDLDFLGRPTAGRRTYPNRTMMVVVIIFWVMMNLALFAGYNIKWSQNMELSVADQAAFAMVNVAMWCFVVFVTQSTRAAVRDKFMIREERCYDLEDLCCATFCTPCTVSQMQRHTANYDDYEAVCCSKNGLPDGVSVSVESMKEGGQYVV